MSNPRLTSTRSKQQSFPRRALGRVGGVIVALGRMLTRDTLSLVLLICSIALAVLFY